MKDCRNPRTILVTGATGHLGRCYVNNISGIARCILVDQNMEKLVEFKAELAAKTDIEHSLIQCDLSNEKSRKSLVRKVCETHKHLDGLVNNAAYTGSSELSGWATSFEKQTLTSWQAALEVNLTSVFEFSQGLSPLLKNSKDGHILNIGSIYGMIGPDMRVYEGTKMGNPAAYAASKGGLVQLTRWLASVLAPDIRVNCVSPGGIFREQPENFVKKYVNKTPLGRMATEDDIVGAMIFLTLGESRYITGQNLVVDGGFSIW